MATLLGARPFFGTIMRIDRANRLVYWRPDGSSEDEEATFDGRRRWAPWPLARARFDVSTRTPHCEHPIGRRERIFRDHFTHVASASRYGDTPWDADVGSGTVTALTGAGLGVVRLRANSSASNTIARLAKSNQGFVIPDAPQAWHMVARVKLPFLTDNEAWVGFLDHASGLDDGCFFNFAPALLGLEKWVVGSSVSAGGVGTSVWVTGADVVADTWMTMDMIAAGGLVAGWVDGDGPYLVSDGPEVVTAGTPTNPFLLAINRGLSVAATLDVDCYAVSLVTVAGKPSS